MNNAMLSTVIVILGLACLAVAAFFVDWRLGLASVGTALVVGGYLAGVPAPPEVPQ